MAEVAYMYNNLPTLGEADAQFVSREAAFHQLATLLAKHGNRFGVCLVHSHCKLAVEEVMVARGNVSEPEQLKASGQYYPERWMSDGSAYEFATRKTDQPPQELLVGFDRIAKTFNLQGTLGLYHIEGDKDAPPVIEWTEGRRNFTRELGENDMAAEPVQTAWDFARSNPVTMPCTIYCDTRTTRSGTNNTHKGTQSHPKT